MGSYTSKGFTNVFLNPPYHTTFGDTISDVGEYFLSFTKLILGELESMAVYSWSTTCSPLFDAGREWWGAYFWTVYNPEKGVFIGIVGSETD